MANSRSREEARHVVEVNEVKVFATGRGSDWWAWFLMAHRNTGRITEVAVSLGGAICHVACDSREDAQWLAHVHGRPARTTQVSREGASTATPPGHLNRPAATNAAPPNIPGRSLGADVLRLLLRPDKPLPPPGTRNWSARRTHVATARSPSLPQPGQRTYRVRHPQGWRTRRVWCPPPKGYSPMTASAKSVALQPLRHSTPSAAGVPEGWCQRWRSRHHSWRHTSEGGFDPNRYVVTPLAERPAREFVTHHHYSATWPAAKLRYALVDRWPVGRFTPSPVALGIGFIVPASLGAGIALGAVAFAYLRRAYPDWSAENGPSLAAGLITGESLTALVFAGLVVAGLL